MLHMLLMEHKEVPWKALGYLTGDIAYGGRVTDAWDNRCLQSIMGKFYTPRALEEDYGYTSNLVSWAKFPYLTFKGISFSGHITTSTSVVFCCSTGF